MAESNVLSRREWDVAQLVLEGKSNKQIAAALHIAESTVEFHLKNIYAKTQVGSRVELILKLRESTVAGGGEGGENNARLSFRNWAARLRFAAAKFGEELKVNNTSDASARGANGSMTFFEAILVCLRKYADFEGRAGRAEFWWFFLFVTLVSAALMYVSENLASIFLIAVLLPLLAVGARRLRDSGKSAWWLLFLLAPVGGLVVVGYLWTLPPVSAQSEDAQA